MAANSIVFEPLQVGDLTLSNRISLAPLTRIRASKEHVPQGEQHEKQLVRLWRRS